MARRALWVPLLPLLSVLLPCGMAELSAPLARRAPVTGVEDGARAATEARFGRLPLRFEENQGQFGEGVRFAARRGGLQLALDDRGADVTLVSRSNDEAGEEQVHTAQLRLRVAGGRAVAPVPSQKLITKSNYFLGDDPAQWHTGVANYGTLTYPGVLDGVDLVYHGENGQLEYDFVVHPGAAVGSIAMNVEGGRELSIDEAGDLLVHTDNGVLRQQRPRVFQRDVHGQEVDVASRFVLVGERSIGFVVAAYDTTRELVIDPQLDYAAVLGGTGADQIWDVAVGADDSVYVTGQTAAANFPQRGANGAVAAQPGLGGGTDGFVAKLNPSGDQLIYATYLGGGGTDILRGIAVDAAGSAYVIGYTNATGYPVTANAYDTSFAANGSNNDVVLSKLNPSGSELVYSTYFGGTGNDVGYGIAVDADGHAHITGLTNSDGLASENAAGFTRTGQDAFATKVAPNGQSLVWSSYIGGSGAETGWGIAVDAVGRVIVTGQTSYNATTPYPVRDGQACGATSGVNAFVMRLLANGSDYDKSFCIGGNGEDVAYAVAPTSNNRAVVVGYTKSTEGFAYTDASVLKGTDDGFVAIVNFAPNAAWLPFASLLGGTGVDRLQDVAVNAANEIYVTGYTTSPSTDETTRYPLQTPSQATFGGGNDVVVTKLFPSGAAYRYSTYFGGTGTEQGLGIALDSAGSAIVVGYTNNTNIVVPAARVHGTRNGNDGLIARFSTPGPVITATPASVPPRGTSNITLSGGGNNPVLTLSANPSGGTLANGVYTAGNVGGVTDVLRATDSENGVRLLEIVVGPGVSITTAVLGTPPSGSLNLAAEGGSNQGFTWELTANPSGGSITAAGVYTAGQVSAVDTVRVVDSLGNFATGQIAVGAAIAVNPAAPATPPRGSLELVASGGSGQDYHWELTANPSGGSITEAGVYTAGTTASVTDIAKVTDSLGNQRSVDIAVGAGVSVSPSARSVTGGTAINFAAEGGDGNYTWSAQALPSGGSLDPASGLYSAGVVTTTVTDIVLATDSLGNSATALIEVTPQPDPNTSSSSSGGSSSSSGGASSGEPGSSSSSGAAGSSSGGEAPSGSSGNGGGETPDGDGGDEGGGCSTTPGAGGQLGNLVAGLGAVALMLQRRRRK